MNEKEFQAILIEERDLLLERMTADLKYPMAITTWDINNGHCDEFVEAVLHRGDVPDLWDVTSDWDKCEADHIFLKWNEKFYDAECIEGVEDYHDLPIFKNQGKTREEVLNERNQSIL